MPDWWDAHLVYLRTRPSKDGLATLARVVLPGSRVTRVRRLGGGISTATSVVRLERRGRTLDVVLKRFRRVGRGAADEWKRLAFAHNSRLLSPEPLALDAHGKWFGAPALVMTKLHGRPDVRPSDLRQWLAQIARSQLAIHDVPSDRVPSPLRGRRYRSSWSLPPEIPRTAMLDRVEAFINDRSALVLRGRRVFGHGDAHPGNLLWARGKVTGIADWSAAGMFHRAREVAYMRADIAVLLGARAADAYTAVYEQELGRSVEHLPYWDLIQGIEAIRWSPLWTHPYREQGADLTIARARRRAHAFVRKALERAETL